jgi:hypothetical protein
MLFGVCSAILVSARLLLEIAWRLNSTRTTALCLGKARRSFPCRNNEISRWNPDFLGLSKLPFSKRMYLSNTEPLTSLSCPLNAVFHALRGTVPRDAGTPLLLLLQIFNLSIISIAVLENVSPTQGYRKGYLFHTNRRSGWDRESNPVHLRGRQRRKPLSHAPRRQNGLFGQKLNAISSHINDDGRFSCGRIHSAQLAVTARTAIKADGICPRHTKVWLPFKARERKKP